MHRDRAAMIRFAFFLCTILCAPFAWAQYKLPTVDEALAISSNTGRPVFAMAGRET